MKPLNVCNINSDLPELSLRCGRLYILMRQAMTASLSLGRLEVSSRAEVRILARSRNKVEIK